MANPKYVCAMKPEEIILCGPLEEGNYIEAYKEKVNDILKGIKNPSLKGKVESSLGYFEAGNDGKLAQSSPSRLVVFQEILPEGKILVSRPRLEIAKENNPDFMSGFYVDCGLNLVSGTKYKTNPVQAKALAADLKKTGIKLDNAKLISYNLLTYDISGKSLSGLIFKLSEKGKDIVRSSVLNTDDFTWDYKPSESGLFGACLYAGGYWGASVEDLSDSGLGGRVVVETTSEAGSRELESLTKKANEILAEQREERKRLIAELSK